MTIIYDYYVALKKNLSKKNRAQGAQGHFSKKEFHHKGAQGFLCRVTSERQTAAQGPRIPRKPAKAAN